MFETWQNHQCMVMALVFHEYPAPGFLETENGNSCIHAAASWSKSLSPFVVLNLTGAPDRFAGGQFVSLNITYMHLQTALEIA